MSLMSLFMCVRLKWMKVKMTDVALSHLHMQSSTNPLNCLRIVHLTYHKTKFSSSHANESSYAK